MKTTLVALILAALADGAVISDRVGATRQKRAPKENGKSFTINQIENKNFKGHDGQMSLVRAHMKYAQKLPDHVSKALENDLDLRLKFGVFSQAGQTGTVQARPAQGVDSEYGVVVEIGSPPQSIPLNLDTGSSDFWTFSTDTKKDQVRGQVLYNPDKSSQSEFQKGEEWKIKYGDNAQANGKVYTDRVQIGDTYVDHQAVQVAVNVSKDIAEDSFVSGIIGMANSAANTVRPTPQQTYIDNIRDQLALPVFTANLQRRAPGTYNFGYIDDSEYTGDIQYAQVDPYSPFWKVSITGYTIGDDDEEMLIDSIVDTGTSLLLLPESVVYEYYSQIDGSRRDKVGMMIYPCDADVPDFYLAVGEYRGRVPGSYINYGPVTAEYCYGGLQSSDGLPFSVLGDVFLKAQFVVFDYADGIVGFANKELDE